MRSGSPRRTCPARAAAWPAQPRGKSRTAPGLREPVAQRPLHRALERMHANARLHRAYDVRLVFEIGRLCLRKCQLGQRNRLDSATAIKSSLLVSTDAHAVSCECGMATSSGMLCSQKSRAWSVAYPTARGRAQSARPPRCCSRTRARRNCTCARHVLVVGHRHLLERVDFANTTYLHA